MGEFEWLKFKKHLREEGDIYCCSLKILIFYNAMSIVRTTVLPCFN